MLNRSHAIAWAFIYPLLPSGCIPGNHFKLFSYNLFWIPGPPNHYTFQVLQGVQVFQGISSYQDEVCRLAFLHTAPVILLPEIPGRLDGAYLQYL